MFVLVHNLTSRIDSVVEIRAQSAAHRMRAVVLREIDRLFVHGEWRRTHSCHMFVCQRCIINPEFQVYTTTLKIISDETWGKRGANVFIQVYLNEKSPGMLAADERRLAVAIEFHERLGARSMLGRIDDLSLQSVLNFAGVRLL